MNLKLFEEGFHTINFPLMIALAVTISWSENHSILWAIFHGLIGWLYVLYYALFVL